MSRGVLIRGGSDEVIESRAQRAGLGVEVGDGWTLPFEQTLVVEAGTRVPWDLLPAAWHFLERWDAAVPLWRYGVLAADVGAAEEQAVTKAVVRDLRVLLHSVELLFVRNNEAGRSLVCGWQDEIQRFEIGDLRLAFLRAVYQVKPRLCVLPTTWLAEVRQWQENGRQKAEGRRSTASDLVTVQIAPGRIVKCKPGDEERIRVLWRRQTARRQPQSEDDMAVVSNKSFTVENQKSRRGRGPLVRVQVDGRVVKMYQQDAVEAGLLAAPQAAPGRPAEEDKGRPAEEEKAAPEEGETAVLDEQDEPEEKERERAVSDDLTTIDGVGKATARLLAANGIMTFEQLRQASDLGFLSSQAQTAVEDWRNG